jgi:hypothetical protein
MKQIQLDPHVDMTLKCTTTLVKSHLDYKHIFNPFWAPCLLRDIMNTAHTEVLLKFSQHYPIMRTSE